MSANIRFENIYTPFNQDPGTTNATQKVIGGLAPPSQYGLSDIPLSYVNLFAITYTMGFMTDPRFVTSMTPVNCSGSACVSIFLPGGMGSVVIDDNTGSYTLFSGGYPGDYTVIVINDAPGYQMEYASIGVVDSGFQFDHDSECKMYLSSVQDGLFLCMVEKGMQLYLGTLSDILFNMYATCVTY
jgi:hypothetical protein